MSHAWRFPAILALSIIFGAPALADLATRPDALVTAGLRYLAAFVLAWAGVAAIGRLVDGYAHHNHRLQQARMVEATRAATADARDAAARDDTEDLSSTPAMS